MNDKDDGAKPPTQSRKKTIGKTELEGWTLSNNWFCWAETEDQGFRLGSVRGWDIPGRAEGGDT